MKKLILSIAFLVVCNIAVYSQLAPKGANKIIIKNNKTASDNFLFVKQFLAENSIQILSQDRDVNQVTTGVIRGKWGTNVKYVLFCKDNSIALSGSFYGGYELSLGGVVAKDDSLPIVNKGGSSKNAFETMDVFAKKLGTEIFYEGGKEQKEIKKSND